MVLSARLFFFPLPQQEQKIRILINPSGPKLFTKADAKTTPIYRPLSLWAAIDKMRGWREDVSDAESMIRRCSKGRRRGSSWGTETEVMQHVQGGRHQMGSVTSISDHNALKWESRATRHAVHRKVEKKERVKCLY